MKTTSILSKLFRNLAIAVSVAASVSCMTTYDSAGRPVQSVDPGVAIAGAAAAGLAGYAIGNNNDNHHYHGGGYYRPRPYYGGYQRRGYYRR